MQYGTYTDRVRQMASLVEAGKYAKALAMLNELIASDIADTDKAVMCMNAAVVSDKLGNTDEALGWYDRGVEFERLAGSFFVTERRAAFLAEKGRDGESVTRYQELLVHPALSETDKLRIRENIDALLRRMT